MTAIAALVDPVRRALYDYVVGSENPVGRDAAAAALGLKRSTAAFHLDRLAAEGLLAVEYRRLSGRTGPGAGRPAKLYRRPDQELAVSVPERRYEVAGEMLAAAIVQSTRSGEPVEPVAHRIAHDVGYEIGKAADSLPAALADYGYRPRPDGSSGWVLGNCPFRQLAREFTDLICGLNIELLRGVADGAEETGYTMVAIEGSNRCCVHVTRA